MAVTPLDNEAHVLKKIAHGDERSFAELFHWYSKPLAEFVFKLTDSVEVREEIIQNFSGYLYILCRNVVYSKRCQWPDGRQYHFGADQRLFLQLGRNIGLKVFLLLILT